RRARARVTREDDEPARPLRADEAVGRQPPAVGKLDRLTLRELAPQRSLRDTCGLRLLDVESPTPHVLLQDVAERRPAAVLGRKRANVVAVARVAATEAHGVAPLHLCDLNRERHAFH